MHMLRAFEKMGYESLVATPHIMAGMHDNEPQGIKRTLERVKEKAREAGIRLRLNAAAEYMIDEGFTQQLNNGLLPIRDQYVLVEQSYLREYPAFGEMLFEIQLKGYIPVLAHPERYFFWHDPRLKKYETLAEKGILLQLNALSLTGYYGPEVKAVAKRLLKAGLYSLISSDAHHAKHMRLLQAGLPISEEQLAKLAWY